MRDGPIQVGDGVALCWAGIGVEGEKQVFESPVQSVRRLPSVVRFDIPAEHFSALSGGRATAHYIVYRETLPCTRSRRAMVSFAGVGGLLPAPTVAEAQEAELSLELIQDHMTVVVAPWPGMRPGQTVRVSWRGENGIAHDEGKPLDAGLVGEEVKVFIARALLEGYAGSRIEISYRIDETGRPPRTSLVRLIRIVGRAPALPAPQVLQARQAVLDPFDALPQATVRVAADAELGFGDEVELHWIGDQPGGVAPPSSRHVYRELAGRPLDFDVDGEFVALNAGGSVEVSYKVFRLDGRVSQSGSLILSVLPMSLPAPVFLEAEGDRLDPDTLGQGATVVIDASARLRAGDRLTLLLRSPNAAGETAITQDIDRDDQPLHLNVAHSLVEASNGHRVSLQYRIERGTGTEPRPSPVSHWRVGRVIASGPFSILGARHNHSTYRTWSAPRRLSAIEPRSLQPMQLEWSYAGSNVWTTASQWVDSQPWLKLFVRSASDALQLNPVNLLGNGNGWASAWVALRDEGVAADGAKADLVAWGDEALGGSLEPALAAVRDIVEVSATRSAYAARRANGDVLCWGVAGEGGLLPAEAGGDFIEVRGNATVFAARKRDGSLVAWGNPTDGGKLPENLAHYRDYTALYVGGRAMAARRADGTLVTWGDPDAGGQMAPGQEHYTDIGQVLGNYEAFVGLRGEGAAARLIAWGDATAGGVLPDAIAHLDDVTALAAATSRAFRVLVGNGHVRVWGMEDYGGVVPPAIAELTDVIEVTATWYAFCARLGDGRVAVWGDERYGGALPEHVGECTDIVQVVGSAWSFAALRKDGSVLTWGFPDCGGDSADVADQLLDVRAIYANNNSFAALTQDGRVVTWGSEKSGGDSSSQQGEPGGKVTSARSISLAEAAAGSSGAGPAIE